MIRRVFAVFAGILVLGVVVLAAIRSSHEAWQRRAMRHNNLGVALIEDRQFDEAVRELEKALVLAPGYTTARYNLGLAQWLSRKDLKGARANLRKIILDDEEHMSACYVLGTIELELGHDKDAESLFRKVLERSPEDFQALLHLGKTLVLDGRREEALVPLSKALAIAPRSPDVAYQIFMAERSETGGKPLRKDLREVLAAKQSFLPDTKRQLKTPADRHSQPVPDSRITREPPELPGGHVDVSRQVGLDFVHAGTRTPELERVLSGEPMAREWFQNPANVSQLVAVASAGCAFLDFDGDDRLDIFIVNSDGTHGLFQATAAGVFHRVVSAGGIEGKPALGTACAAGDMDDDGLPELVVAGLGEIRLYSNESGRFRDITDRLSAHPLFAWSGSWCTGAAWADVDHDADLDILVTRGVDLSRPKPGEVVRFPESFPAERSLLFRNNGDGTFLEVGVEALPPETTSGLRGAFFSDVDGDIAIDLVTVDLRGKAAVSRSRRDGTFAAWPDVEAPPFETAPLGEARAHGDFDPDGSPDLLVSRSGAPAALFRNTTVLANWLTVRLEGYTGPGQKSSNRRAIGGKADVRSIGIWRRKELRAGNVTGGTDAPELYFDLGIEDELDFARGIFPSGGRATHRNVKSNQVLVIKEPRWNVNSCPTVFTWNGTRFDFIADTTSAGILGEATGPGSYWTPQPEEWLRIDGSKLLACDGKLDVRWTNPLEEVTYLDRVRLVAVDHPSGLEVHPNERMVGDASSRTPSRFYALGRSRPIVEATSHRGSDATETLAREDRSYFDDFELLPWKGFAEDWSLTLDLGPSPGRALLLHGWTSWNSSASVIAASQAGKALHGPHLDVLGTDGAWRRALDDLGVPAGLPRTMLVDLQAMLRAGERVVRISTNRMVYLDHSRTADVIEILEPGAAPEEGSALAVVEAPLVTAELRRLGYPRRKLPDGKLPEVFDYTEIEAEAEWGSHEGFLTRFGDVKELLASRDDRFVILGHGEEIALSFDPAVLPPPAAGRTRTYLLYSRGYEKGLELHSAMSATVEPLPFSNMGSYPYPDGAYPLDEERLRWMLEWNTRPSGGGR